MSLTLLVVFIILFTIPAFSQDKPRPVKSDLRELTESRTGKYSRQFDAILSQYDREQHDRKLAATIAKEKRQKAEAYAYARVNRIPVKVYHEDGSFDELQKLAEDGTPIYYTLENVDAAESTRADWLNTGGGLGLNVNGDNLTAHVWDGGPTRPTHQEFDGPGGSNRVTINDGVTTLNGNSFHAQHVTGTIVASGFVPAAKGMAWQANALTHDWNSDESEARSAAIAGMLISNHSYGYNATSIPDSWFGQYGSDASAWDDIMYDYPYYLMTQSAGNDGNNNTANAQPLDGQSAYDKLNGAATAKNNMVVANGLDAVINGDGTLSSVSRNSGSSEGPTDDYRIKPDIMGNGTGLYSCYDGSDSQYNSISGTSMSSPNVAGSMLLLQEHYNDLNASFARAATIKGLTLHTADDVASSGPDAQTGWGLMNTKAAAETISTANSGGYAIVSELTLNQGQTYQIILESNGIDPLMASISWTDPARTAISGTNNTTPALVNDLDLRLDNGTNYTPWRLTGVSTNGTGDNNVDPFERVDVSGASGNYTLTVTHKGTLSSGSQDYTLIVTGGRIAPVGPEISFASTTGSTSEGTDCSFTDLNVQLNIGQAPSANADVNFTVNGSSTASNLIDFQLMTPSVTFPSGSTAPQNMTLRIFHDGFVEVSETIIVDFTVNANGGDATANTSADTYTLTINDNDAAPVASYSNTLGNWNMNDLSGWQVLDNDGDGNNWLSLTGLTYTHIDGTFIGSETDLTVLGGPGAGSANADNFLISPSMTIDAASTDVEFQFGVGGYQTTEHYAVYWTTDITNATTMQQLLLEERDVAAVNSSELRTLNTAAIAGQTGYFIIRHFNSSSNDGILLFDNLLITETVTTGVQTAINSGNPHQVDLAGPGTYYSSHPSTGDMIVDVTNNDSHDYGCVDSAVSRSGTGAQSYMGSVSPNLVMDKTFVITPITDASNVGDVTVNFYFEEAEISGWESATGLLRTDLIAQRDGASFSENSSLTIGAFGSHVTLSGNFSDLDGTFYFGNAAAFGACLSTTTFSGSWDNGVPTSSATAVISSNYDTAVNGGSLDACEIQVTNNSTLTISADDYLNVNGNIVVDSGSSLIVAHTGSVVQVDPDAAVTNNGTINVNITTPVLQTRDFMVMGSPMSGETRTGVYNSAFLVLQHTPANFIPHSSVPAGGTNFADDNGDFWNQIASGNITPGEGFIVRPQSGYSDPANTTYNFTHDQGTLNNGNVVRSVIYNGGSNPDGTPNVFSNPYASPIFADDFINGNSLVNEVYFWEHLTPPSNAIPGARGINFSMDDISMYNLSGGTAAANDPGTTTEPNGYISTGQGFGIKAFGNGSVTFTNAMRRTTGNNTLRDLDVTDRIWLRVSNDRFDYELGSNTLIAFNPIATQDLDAGYDSERIATVVSLFSQLENSNKQLGIQTFGAFDVDMKIPMGFASQVDEEIEYTIAISDLDGARIENATVYLIDNELNRIVNLSDGDYVFRSDKGTFENRFTLQFEYETLGSNEASLESIGFFPNPTRGIVNIVSPQSPISGTRVFDLQGRIIQDMEFNAERSVQLDLSSLETAVYFVEVTTETGTIIRRIIRE